MASLAAECTTGQSNPVGIRPVSFSSLRPRRQSSLNALALHSTNGQGLFCHNRAPITAGTHHRNTDPGGAMNDLFGPESRRDLIAARLQPPRFRPPGGLVDRGRVLAVLQRGGAGPGALGDAQPPARRGQDQRQRKPHGPLPRGGRGDPQDRQPGGALPLQRNVRVQRRSWPRSRESPKTT